ncbi:MAG: hypothetical protein BWY76_01402 [bacterium ADurb.Bin429]|nr:MAG: hypothetical protein BWY76_01402 [bacterium ADurb.Bin429]
MDVGSDVRLELGVGAQVAPTGVVVRPRVIASLGAVRVADGEADLLGRSLEYGHGAAMGKQTVERVVALGVGGLGLVGRAAEHLGVLDIRLQRTPPAVPGGVIDYRVALIVVLGVHLQRQADLLDVAQTGGLARLGPGPSEYREEDGRQNGDNGYHHQQLDEGKTSRTHCVLSPLYRRNNPPKSGGGRAEEPRSIMRRNREASSRQGGIMPHGYYTECARLCQ